jgi:hypothetical protein
MRITAHSLAIQIGIFALIATLGSARAIDTRSEEAKCADIGFTKGTEAFGSCVLELIERTNSKVDSSEDHSTCARYGFRQGTTEYSQCRMQIDLAKSQALEQQRNYDRQVAEQKKARDRAKGEAALLMGLGMMAGQSPSGYGNSALIQAPPSTRTYSLPGGRFMTCNTIGTNTNCQ